MYLDASMAAAAPPAPGPVLRPLSESPTYRIHHYPSTLIDVRQLADGSRLTLRPVLPQDEPLLEGLVARLSARTRRQRFHGGGALSAAQLHRMACIDYAQDFAVVVTAGERGREAVVADARYCVDPDAQGAEFALVVDDRWQRCGLGGWAMQALCEAAGAAGLTWLHGEVLRDNLPMRALMQRCGLCCTVDPEDDTLLQLQLRLGHLPLAPEAIARPRWHGVLGRLARCMPGSARKGGAQ